ncbi:MAG: DUF1576 domain-containing protein [Bacillota bacterium]|nr:DUF1576 domain-containing protein [Bacillota bacterium]
MLVFPVALLLYGVIHALLFEGGLGAIPNGMRSILLSPNILITDFFLVGGIGASCVNAAVISLFNLYLLRHFRMRINGLLIAAFFTVLGFSFFGKNILNILPLYAGGYLYARFQKMPMKNVILVTMFSTALAPLVSFIAFGGIFKSGFAYFMAMMFGIGIGFVIMPLSAHMLRFHDGYNLYNIGFTAGMLGTVITSALRSFAIEVQPVSLIYEQSTPFLTSLVIALFLYLIVVGYLIDPKIFVDYKTVLQLKGRTVTDLTSLVDYGLTFFNMGVMGLIAVTVVLLLGGVVNGPILAGIFSIVGFSAFGKQPANSLPIMAGVLLAGLFFDYNFSSTMFLISMLFSTAIAPIAGAYGPIVGVIAGMLHLTLVFNIGIIHGGINLYNNGFSGGIAVAFLLPIIEAFRRDRD